jgi:serine/threonine protein kinase
MPASLFSVPSNKMMMTGKTISHYRIAEKLGEGGMGVVYKAQDMHLDRFVGLKIPPAERVADPDRKRRFVQEAKAASSLNHPHIVTFMTSMNWTVFTSSPWNMYTGRRWTRSFLATGCG